MHFRIVDAIGRRSIAVNKSYKIYVVRDGNTVLYVGKSERHPVTHRLRRHMGQEHPHLISALGQFILDHRPASDDWQVEVLTLKDCNQLFQEHGLPLRRTWHTAEHALIQLHRPCLNWQGNSNPTPLPEKYEAAGRKAAPRARLSTGLRNLWQRIFVRRDQTHFVGTGRHNTLHSAKDKLR